MTFNPDNIRTADGVLIEVGLEVLTNNLDRGRITGKVHEGDYGKEKDLWFEVELHTSYTGSPKTGRDSFNAERLATRLPR